jgi:hypothetical protein
VNILELVLERFPSISFRRGKVLKPITHDRMATVYAKATLDNLRNASSRRQERVKTGVE